jgi:hypothetical protein
MCATTLFAGGGVFRTGEGGIVSVGLGCVDVDVELSTWALGVDVGELLLLFSPLLDRERFTLLLGKGGGGGDGVDGDDVDSVSADGEFNLSSTADGTPALTNATCLPPPGMIFSSEGEGDDPLLSRFSLLVPSPQLTALSPNALAIPHKPRRRGGSGGGAFPCRGGSMLLLDDSWAGVGVDVDVVEPVEEVRDGEAGGVDKITSSSQTFSTIPVRMNDQRVQVALSRARHQPDVQRG